MGQFNCNKWNGWTCTVCEAKLKFNEQRCPCCKVLIDWESED